MSRILLPWRRPPTGPVRLSEWAREVGITTLYLPHTRSIVDARFGNYPLAAAAGNPKVYPVGDPRFGAATGFGGTAGTSAADRLGTLSNGFGAFKLRTPEFPQDGAAASVARTWMWWLHPFDGGGGNLGRIVQPVGSTGFGGEGIWCGLSSSYKVLYSHSTVEAGDAQWGIAGSIAMNQWSLYGMSHLKGDMTALPIWFENDVFATNTTNAAANPLHTWPKNTIYNMDVGNRSTDGARGWNGYLGPGLFGERHWATLENYLKVKENFWITVEPERIWVPVGGASTTPVSSDLDSSYAIIGKIQTDYDAIFNIVGIVVSDLDATYNVLSATAVTSDLDSSYAIIGKIQADLDASYNVIGKVTTDLDVSYDILNDIPSITTEPFSNNADGDLLTGETGITVALLKFDDMSMVAVKTGETTHATTGVMTVEDAGMDVGDDYVVVSKMADGSLGVEKYTASA